MPTKVRKTGSMRIIASSVSLLAISPKAIT
jgi:hypothetical protein